MLVPSARGSCDGYPNQRGSRHPCGFPTHQLPNPTRAPSRSPYVRRDGSQTATTCSVGREMEPELLPESLNSEEEEDENGGGGGWGGVASTALARGWCLGKKVAIAGAAVATAPIVIPPLLLVSALGLAFSIPSAAYFASVACTNKLMGSLLPLPPQEEQEDEGSGGESARAMDPFSLSPECASAAVEDQLSNMVDYESGLSMEHGWYTGGEGLYSEKKLWEQIVALRTIIGYKADPHSTCIEQLEALFLVTGVEPPVSYEDADLMEVTVMVWFLKSLVGVE